MPAAPWWAFLVPVVIDAVKSIIGGAKDEAKERHAESLERRKRRRIEREKQKMTDFNIPHIEDFEK